MSTPLAPIKLNLLRVLKMHIKYKNDSFVGRKTQAQGHLDDKYVLLQFWIYLRTLCGGFYSKTSDLSQNFYRFAGLTNLSSPSSCEPCASFIPLAKQKPSFQYENCDNLRLLSISWEGLKKVNFPFLLIDVV